MRDLAGAMEGLEGKTLKKNVKLEKSQRPKGGSAVGVMVVTGRNQTVGVPLHSGLHLAGNREVFQRGNQLWQPKFQVANYQDGLHNLQDPVPKINK